jgi:hypothetical protein
MQIMEPRSSTRRVRVGVNLKYHSNAKITLGVPLIDFGLTWQLYRISLCQARLSLAFDVHQEATDNANSFF